MNEAESHIKQGDFAIMGNVRKVGRYIIVKGLAILINEITQEAVNQIVYLLIID